MLATLPPQYRKHGFRPSRKPILPVLSSDIFASFHKNEFNHGSYDVSFPICAIIALTYMDIRTHNLISVPSQGDRFIPSRGAMDLDIAHFNLFRGTHDENPPSSVNLTSVTKVRNACV